MEGLNDVPFASRRITSHLRIQLLLNASEDSRKVEYENIFSCLYKQIFISLFYVDVLLVGQICKPHE